MTAQPTAATAGPAEVLAPGYNGTAATGQPGELTLRAERLDYIAEIVSELKVMATRAGCPTLSGLLDLAYQEARLRRRA